MRNYLQILFILYFSFVPNAYSIEQSGLHFDKNKPIEITANTLVIDDVKNQGNFAGNVNIRQNEFNLSSDNITVIYDRNDGKGDNNKIKKIIALGNVLISSPAEKVTSNKATYDVINEKITLDGDILITRAEGVLSGDIATIDLKTRHIDIKSRNNKRIYSVIHLKDKK